MKVESKANSTKQRQSISKAQSGAGGQAGSAHEVSQGPEQKPTQTMPPHSQKGGLKVLQQC